MIRGDGHARQQVDGPVFQAADAFGIGTRNILDADALFHGEVREKIGRDPFCLTVCIGENQGRVFSI